MYVIKTNQVAEEICGAEEKTIQERFEQFHRDNPHVYKKLVEMSFKAKQKGFKKIGIDLLVSIIRWEEPDTEIYRGNEDFKLSNDFRSRYARLIMDQEQDLFGLFNIRPLREKPKGFRGEL